ncbi:MAG TPA: YjgN family protein [Anaeromyxobacteraceae bacterium]|nr:YjgN family protein [Anaeromyxobacteraceae bacterium]
MSELASVPALLDASPSAPAPQPQRLPIRFTGQGGEYFRIWIVNVLLTLLTLGIWSAWAKVRTTRYFCSNTQLGGAAFQYHGNPAAILRGRLLAAAIFITYSVAGRVSVSAGLVAGVALTLLSPWLFYTSMRFKLANTSWRGLRFGFESTAREAYAALAPAVVVGVILFAALARFQRVGAGEQPNPAPVLLAELLVFALAPWLHARVKAYQHGRARYGALAFRFEPSTGAFYGLYGKTFLVALPFGILAGAGVTAVVVATRSWEGGPAAAKAALVPTLAVVYTVMTLAYVVAGGFLAARLQRLVWTRTHAGPVRFTTTVRARGLVRLWLVNGLLTLLTLGLYWPWAAVAIARYRLESTTVEAGAPLETIAAGSLAPERSTTGEGAVDFFGWDIGL